MFTVKYKDGTNDVVDADIMLSILAKHNKGDTTIISLHCGDKEIDFKSLIKNLRL